MAFLPLWRLFPWLDPRTKWDTEQREESERAGKMGCCTRTGLNVEGEKGARGGRSVGRRPAGAANRGEESAAVKLLLEPRFLFNSRKCFSWDQPGYKAKLKLLLAGAGVQCCGIVSFLPLLPSTI